MENVGSGSPQHDGNRSESTPAGGGTSEPIRPDENPPAASPGVSRAPLNLGGSTAAPATPVAPKAPILRPVAPRPAAAANDRITGCKTFFTKLHPGAMHFLDELIIQWLKENPSISIKRTNMIAGEITEKKTEPSIIIVVWY
ncbi:MAG: hypothetical protein A2Y76_08600 [Planctomycetes bacterium RBG_13_60_9]|nr:MAG: hypothetical protein A2Y76_08600 [Planctomycetes bacterium RBG_13_60_9]